jgi:O-antigen/teichoic acid export membrane protein
MVGSLIGHHFISIGGALPYYLLPIFVTARLSAEANAYFYTTWMLGTLFGMVSVSVAQSLFAEGAHADTPLLHSMNRSIRIILVLLAPLMALFILFGGFILGIFGEKYPAQGLTLLHVLTLATIPDAITSVYISILRVQERLREAAILNIIMAVIVLAFSWVFLPSMGIAAVGWGWFASQVAGTIIAGCDYFVTRRNRPQLWAERPKAVPDAITS